MLVVYLAYCAATKPYSRFVSTTCLNLIACGLDDQPLHFPSVCARASFFPCTVFTACTPSPRSTERILVCQHRGPCSPRLAYAGQRASAQSACKPEEPVASVAVLYRYAPLVTLCAADTLGRGAAPQVEWDMDEIGSTMLPTRTRILTITTTRPTATGLRSAPTRVRAQRLHFVMCTRRSLRSATPVRVIEGMSLSIAEDLVERCTNRRGPPFTAYFSTATVAVVINKEELDELDLSNVHHRSHRDNARATFKWID